MLGFSSPLRAEPKVSSVDRSEKGFSSPFRSSRPASDRRRRPTRFTFESLEPRLALSSVTGMAPAVELLSEPDVPETGPGPDGLPPIVFPPIPDGPVLPA